MKIKVPKCKNCGYPLCLSCYIENNSDWYWIKAKCGRANCPLVSKEIADFPVDIHSVVEFLQKYQGD